MKKFITAAALLAASTALASAATVSLLPTTTSITTSLETGTHNNTLGGWNTSTVVSVSATDVNTYLGSYSDQWVLTCGTRNSALPEASTLTGVTYGSDGSASFSLIGRPAYRGKALAAVVSLSSLLTEDTDTLSKVSVSFTSSASAGTFSAWTISGGTATSLIAETALSSAVSGTTLEASDLSLSSSDKVVFLFNTQGTSGNTAVPVSSFTATGTVSSIPEPSAFGLLAGAGALALVAARRRRSRKA